MNLNFNDRELQLLVSALQVSMTPPAYGDSVLRSVMRQEEEGDLQLRQELIATILELPRFQAEARAFERRIDALQRVDTHTPETDQIVDQLSADLKAWKISRHVEDEKLRLRTIVEFLG